MDIERDSETGVAVRELWHHGPYGTPCRIDGPAIIERDRITNVVTHEEWRVPYERIGVLHTGRTDGPAIVERDSATGAVIKELWMFVGRQYKDRQHHRAALRRRLRKHGISELSPSF